MSFLQTITAFRVRCQARIDFLGSVSIFALYLMSPGVALAQFALDFTPNAGGSISTGMCKQGFCDSGRTHPQTSFLQQGGGFVQLPEVVTDPATGRQYYHIIVGDPADGFAQEVFIYKSTAFSQQDTRGDANSASFGAGGTILTTGQHYDSNAHDIFGVTGIIDSGNGSANPTSVIVRQILNDGELSQEFLKDNFAKKPRITQIAFGEDINMFFDLDMRNSTYTDNSKAGSITNFLTLEPSLISLPEVGIGDFSMMTDQSGNKSIVAGGRDTTNSANINVTGGRYTWSGPSRGKGTYTYIEGGFDHTKIDWEQFFDASIGNLWTYGDYQPNGGTSIVNP